MVTFEQQEQNPLDQIPSQPSVYPSGWGEFIGVGITAVIVIAREFLRRDGLKKAEEKKAQDELILFLKNEVRKRDQMISQLNNQINLLREYRETEK